MSEIIQLELSRRNATTVMAALARMEETISAQQKRIDSLANGVSSFASRVADLERTIALGKAASMGRGPTVVTP
jgi:hypothetical protein